MDHSENSNYYTADAATMSFRDLWRQLPVPVVLKPLAMIAFYFFRTRHGNQATVAYERPESLNVIAAEKVPSAVVEKFEPFLRCCVEAEFTLQFFYVSSGIGPGSTTMYSAVLLDTSRVVSAVTVCEYGAADEAVISQGSYSFQSGLTDGSLLLTTPANRDALAMNLDPPNWKIVGLPLTTEVQDVLIAHRERLSDVSQRPRQFDAVSLRDFILTETQAHIDHGLATGRYRWLSTAELDDLNSEARNPVDFSGSRLS